MTCTTTWKYSTSSASLFFVRFNRHSWIPWSQQTSSIIMGGFSLESGSSWQSSTWYLSSTKASTSTTFWPCSLLRSREFSVTKKSPSRIKWTSKTASWPKTQTTKCVSSKWVKASNSWSLSKKKFIYLESMPYKKWRSNGSRRMNYQSKKSMRIMYERSSKICTVCLRNRNSSWGMNEGKKERLSFRISRNRRSSRILRSIRMLIPTSSSLKLLRFLSMMMTLCRQSRKMMMKKLHQLFRNLLLLRLAWWIWSPKSSRKINLHLITTTSWSEVCPLNHQSHRQWYQKRSILKNQPRVSAVWPKRARKRRRREVEWLQHPTKQRSSAKSKRCQVWRVKMN